MIRRTLVRARLGALLLMGGCSRDRGEVAPATASFVADEPEPAVAGEEGDDRPATALGPAPAPGAARGALLAEVDRELAAMKTSAYSHHAHVDEGAGAFAYDCSGFLDYALSRAVPDALAAVQATTPRRPRSKDFVAFLAAIPAGGARGRWRRVARVQDLVPGDVIVWLRPPDSRSTNTGHTLIVHGPVAPDAEQPGAFVIPIADSTERPHVPGDSRSATNATGLGRGEIVVVTDESGAPVAFRWSRGRKSRAKPTTIALGRVL